MKQLWLHLDDLLPEGFPSTNFDIGGLGHHIVIEAENKEKAIQEMVDEYRLFLKEGFHEEEDEE